MGISKRSWNPVGTKATPQAHAIGALPLGVGFCLAILMATSEYGAYGQTPIAIPAPMSGNPGEAEAEAEPEPETGPARMPDAADRELIAVPTASPWDRPLRTPESERTTPTDLRAPLPQYFPPLLTPRDPPLGYAGPSGILPPPMQATSDYVPIHDRWRSGFPSWSRSDTPPKGAFGHPAPDVDSPYELGHWWDPFNQNRFKGDYPIIGEHTFLEMTAKSSSLFEARQIPTATTPRESTARAGQYEFFGRPDQFLMQQNLVLKMNLFHGDTAFKPADWKLVLTPIFNANTVAAEELGVVSPDVLAGTQRTRTFWALEEYYFETKLADTSPFYDFASIRIGSQPFVSDFKGFLFHDVNRGVRLFGTRDSNRDQYNVAVFAMAEKDTNSDLNTFHSREQTVVVANYFRQDFGFPGYTTLFSLHYNHDEPSFKYDRNRFLVRPDPVGVAQPHQLDVFYLGWGGDGHIGRYNLSHQFYWALGYDSMNPLANRPQNINAQFFAMELSYDKDWMRFRSSFLYSSGDGNANNQQAGGFDTILDRPNFAGGGFSFFQRQNLPLFGVNLTQRQSFVTNLRSSKTQGQSNFVNPGLLMPNLGVDLDLTPKLRMINNVNFLWLHQMDPLRQFLFTNRTHHFLGVDLSMGMEYRPLLSNNIMIEAGVNTLLPGIGFRDIYNDLSGPVPALVSGFVDVVLTY